MPPVTSKANWNSVLFVDTNSKSSHFRWWNKLEHILIGLQNLNVFSVKTMNFGPENIPVFCMILVLYCGNLRDGTILLFLQDIRFVQIASEPAAAELCLTLWRLTQQYDKWDYYLWSRWSHLRSPSCDAAVSRPDSLQRLARIHKVPLSDVGLPLLAFSSLIWRGHTLPFQWMMPHLLK